MRELPAGAPGHYPRGVVSVQAGMPSLKAFLVSLPVALAGAWGLASGAGRISAVRAEMTQLEAAGRAEGESYMKTLQGAHAERQLEHFDRRRALALELARARRNELLGLLGLVAAALIFLGVTVVQRVGREIGEERERLSGGSGGGAPPPT